MRARASRGANVLIEPEEVVRIVALFHFRKAVIVRPIGLFDARALVAWHEVDVSAARGEGRRRLEKIARPSHGGVVLRLIAPARVHVHDEMRSPQRIGGGVERYATHGAAKMGDEDLAFG